MMSWLKPTRKPNRAFTVGRPFAGLATLAIAGAIAAIAVAPSAYASGSAPVGNNDSYTTAYNTTTPEENVLANDTDPEGDQLVVHFANGQSTEACSQNGQLVINPDGTVTYTPPSGFTGTDTCAYTPNDGTSDGNATTVNVTVNPPDPPKAVNFNVVVTINRTTKPIDVTAGATNACGGALTVSITKPTPFGESKLDSNRIVYTAPGASMIDELRYTLTDACGHASNQASVYFHMRKLPVFTVAVTNASPHQANGSVTFRIGNLSDKGGTDTYRVCVQNHGCKYKSIANGVTANGPTFTGLREGDRPACSVALVDEPAATTHTYVGVKPVVKFTAAIAPKAVSGKAKAGLLNYWSGKPVTVYVRDGYGTWHKYAVAKEKNATVYVPTPRGKHAVSVALGSKAHVVSKRTVAR